VASSNAAFFRGAKDDHDEAFRILPSRRSSVAAFFRPRAGVAMTQAELRKQISIFITLSDWKAIRQEAARRQIPMTELCRQWMSRDMQKLRSDRSADAVDAAQGDC
jgi:hypothetical protein